jgi:23S rRNA (uridine2552-2'-O)-methyltransferase
MLFRPTSSLLSKHSSSRQWIARQFNDPYVKKRLADPAAYRSRSAFKLLEMDSQWDNFLSKQDVQGVVDLGAAPGGWSQVLAGKLGFRPNGNTPSRGSAGARNVGWSLAVGQDSKRRAKPALDESDDRVTSERKPPSEAANFDPLNIDDIEVRPTGGRGTIVAVDLLRMQPIHGVHSVVADFLAPETGKLIHGLLAAKGCPDGKVDVILSDMAANASGNETHDVQSSLRICEAVLSFAEQHLRTAKSIGRKRGGVIL